MVDTFRFRPHRGSLSESLKDLVEIIDLDHLRRHVQRTMGAEVVDVHYYAMDLRVPGWTTTCIVMAEWPDGSKGPCGFINRKLVI
jgi:hypothetical protein